MSADRLITDSLAADIAASVNPYRAVLRAGWQPYDGVYPLREEGWLMAPDSEIVNVARRDKPIDDLEDDAPDVPNDDVTVETKTTVSPSSENDDDQADEKENPNG